MHELTDDQLVLRLREAIDSQAMSLGMADAAECVGRARARASARRRQGVPAVAGLAAAIIVALVVGLGYGAWRTHTEGVPSGTVGYDTACSTVPDAVRTMARPTAAVAPTATAGPTAIAGPTETAAPADTAAPAESAAPADTAAPAHTAAPTDTTSPADTTTPAGTASPEASTGTSETAAASQTAATAAPAAAHGTFTATGSLADGPRAQQTATRLCDGRVLIAGGVNGGDAQGMSERSSAELYDPVTGKFSPTGSMGTRRAGHTATLLSDGRVLIAGGEEGTTTCTGCQPVTSAELYDPMTGKFSPTGAMSTARVDATATLLRDGRVLIAGGNVSSPYSETDFTSLASAELYDPATGRFSPTGSMGTSRAGATATLLQNGQVLIAGGTSKSTAGGSSDELASAELYDPNTGKFSPTGAMGQAIVQDTATLLQNGRVLMAGGPWIDGSAIAPAELYDPQTGRFSLTGKPSVLRQLGCTATLLPDGRVLITGGLSGDASSTALSSAELYDPQTGTFSPAGSMITGRILHTATLLTDGRVLLVGGYGGMTGEYSGKYIPAAELYQP